MEPCMEIFLESIKTESTKKSYQDAMRYFKDFAEIKTYQNIVDMEPKKLTQLIATYIIHRKKTNNPNSMGFYYHPIQSFLEMNDVLINFKKLRKLFPAKIKTVVERGWTTEEIQKMLNVCSNTKQRAIIHFENGSGGRIGIFDGLKIKHLIEINDDEIGKCYAIIGYADEIEEYITFLTPEATEALDNYLDKRRSDNEVIGEESPVFRTNYKLGSAKVVAATSKSLSSIVRYVQKAAGLRDPSTKKWNRFSVPANHGFRHRFDEVIKSVPGINVHLAEKMFAHTSRIVPLDGTYHTPKMENSFAEYKKIITLLTISDDQRAKYEKHVKDNKLDRLAKENNQLKEHIKKLPDQENEISDLKTRLANMEKEWYLSTHKISKNTK